MAEPQGLHIIRYLAACNSKEGCLVARVSRKGKEAISWPCCEFQRTDTYLRFWEKGMSGFHLVRHLDSGFPKHAPLSCGQRKVPEHWDEHNSDRNLSGMLASVFSWLGKERKRKDLPACVEHVYLQANVPAKFCRTGLVLKVSQRSQRDTLSSLLLLSTPAYEAQSLW